MLQCGGQERMGLARDTQVFGFFSLYFSACLKCIKIIIMPYKRSNILNLNNPLNYKKKQSGLKTKVSRFRFLGAASLDSSSSEIFKELQISPCWSWSFNKPPLGSTDSSWRTAWTMPLQRKMFNTSIF